MKTTTLTELELLLDRMKNRIKKEEVAVENANIRIDTLRVVQMDIEAAIERERATGGVTSKS